MFETIRKTARILGVPEHILREMVARGECPGMRSGNRWLVNVEQLRALLDSMSMCSGKEERNE